MQGRPAAAPEIFDPEILRELRLLQAVVAVPLLAHGELVAVLALGQPVFGATYGRHEMQTLFDLAAHLATVLRDITLHHQLDAGEGVQRADPVRTCRAAWSPSGVTSGWAP